MEIMQHMTRVLHSTHIFLFSRQKVLWFRNGEQREEKLIPQLLSCLDVDNAS